jgi:hypothetical protein
MASATMALWATPMRAMAKSACVRRRLSSLTFHGNTDAFVFAFQRHVSRSHTVSGARRFLSTRAANGDDKPASEWDIAGLTAEARRHSDRTTKKVAKATTKLRLALEQVAALEHDPLVSLEQLEKCPDVLVFEQELKELKERAVKMHALTEQLREIKHASDARMELSVATAIALEVGDAPPRRAPRGPPRQKGAPTGPRKPYWTYVSLDGVEIVVGRKSEDNDELSCNPQHRRDDEWWMHVAGSPGSHVVIRCVEAEPPRETVRDAAVLAFENSKTRNAGKGSVSLVRCKQVSKPNGAPSGLVRLNGNVASVNVTKRDVAERLPRLMETKK